ncbi:MAG TPA: dUTP diphosphatase [Planctomycetota bacterium]|jgi:dUTP pyrophosphatase|nr:dUTP diphosphatase [Planctomycetota bacterium]
MSALEVKIRRLPGNADLPLPSYQTKDAVGMDVHAAVTSDLSIAPGEVVGIPCGFSMEVPPGYEAQVRPRSGLAAKNAISLANTPGTIDPDYRGEVKILLINHGKSPFVVTRGMRIAQMLVLPVPRVAWVEVEELPSTERGAGGFGHTGH